MLVRAICLRSHWRRSFTDVEGLFGTVVTFDRVIGLGEIVSGEATFPFHATSLTNGSRNIVVGAEVAFVTLHASGGRLEAGRVTECFST